MGIVLKKVTGTGAVSGYTNNTVSNGPYLLQSFLGAAASAAYSLRKLRSAYTGSAIRVRRSSDSTEQDIGFTNNMYLDTGSLLSFVGSGHGFITKWYDQSGNARDAVQATTTYQPTIVLTGSMSSEGIRPAVYFDGSGRFLTGVFSGTDLNNASFVARLTTTSVGPIYSLFGTRFDTVAGPPVLGNTGVVRVNGTTYYNATSTAQDIRDLTYGTTGANQGSLYFNGNIVSTANSASTYHIGFVTTGRYNDLRIYGGIDIGVNNATNRNWIGNIQEIIYWANNDLSATRLNIENNINNYYRVYGSYDTSSASPVVGRMSISTKPTPSSDYLIDTYSGAAVAYSLRKLKKSYSGPIVRVRRSIDSVESDIFGDSNGNLDTTALMSFIGYQNLITNSEDFFTGGYVSINGGAASNVTAAPTGLITADSVTENTSTGGHGIMKTNQSLTSTSASMTTWSCYIKNAGRNVGGLHVYYNTSPFDGFQAYWNLTTGELLSTSSVASGVLVSTSATNAGNGWWRCSITGYTTKTGNHDVVVYMSDNNTGASYTGNGTSAIYIWGSQINTGGLQPYFSTTTAASANTSIGYVTKWYNQLADGNDITQPTAANQPTIVSSGQIVTVNNKPAITFAWNTPLLFTSGFFSSKTAISIFAVAKTPYAASDAYIFAPWDTTTYNQGFNLMSSRTSGGSDATVAVNGVKRGTTNTAPYKLWNDNIQTIFNVEADASGLQGYKNGAAVSFTDASGITALNYASVYGLGTGYTGYGLGPSIQEFVIYFANKSSVHSGIETNQNTYYQTY